MATLLVYDPRLQQREAKSEGLRHYWPLAVDWVGSESPASTPRLPRPEIPVRGILGPFAVSVLAGSRSNEGDASGHQTLLMHSAASLLALSLT